MLLPALEFWPDPDRETLRERSAEVNKMVGHDTEITETEQQRHPTMHHTDTLDVGIVLSGEIYCILDAVHRGAPQPSNAAANYVSSRPAAPDMWSRRAIPKSNLASKESSSIRSTPTFARDG